MIGEAQYAIALDKISHRTCQRFLYFLGSIASHRSIRGIYHSLIIIACRIDTDMSSRPPIFHLKEIIPNARSMQRLLLYSFTRVHYSVYQTFRT